MSSLGCISQTHTCRKNKVLNFIHYVAMNISVVNGHTTKCPPTFRDLQCYETCRYSEIIICRYSSMRDADLYVILGSVYLFINGITNVTKIMTICVSISVDKADDS